MPPPESTAVLPLAPRRRPRRDLGRRVAKGICFGFALLGLVPFFVVFVLRSGWTRAWAAQETARLLKKEGISATYGVGVRLWPLAVEVDDLTVASNDGKGPAVAAHRVLVRPRFFALLSGKLAIDQIEVDEPRIRVVVKDGKLQNLDVKLEPSGESKPMERAPFDVVAVTDGEIDVDYEGNRLALHELDVDVTAEQELGIGPVFEVALRAGNGTVHRVRPVLGATPARSAADDDALCSLEGRLRIEPNGVLVRRLRAAASVDMDEREGDPPSCDLPRGDKRRVELGVGHLRVRFPEKDGAGLQIDGHVRARAPLVLAGRFVEVPDIDGWIGADADVRFTSDMVLPEVTGHLEGGGLRIGKYRLAEQLDGDVTVQGETVRSPKLTLRLGDGDVTLSDTVFEKNGFKLRTRLDVEGLEFASLMRDLGIHPHAHVGWKIHELHAATIAGTVLPLKLDGDFTAKTSDFGVYEGPADDPARERIVGFREAQLAAHVAVRPDAVKFLSTRVQLPDSLLDGGYVSLGFDDDLRVDVPTVRVTLEEISPIGPVKMGGEVRAEVHVGGKFGTPEPVGDVQQITNFTVADMAFGNVTGAHVRVDVDKPLVELTAIKATKGKSEYEVPTARLGFGVKGFVVDAVATTNGLEYHDFLSMFALDDDPRFADYGATIGARAVVHVALGGPEDKCGGGFISVRSRTKLRDVTAFGERFASGEADLEYTWHDREQGIAGADVDIRSFVLNKASVGGASLGTVLGAASIRRGGALDAHVVVDGIPLSRVDALGDYRKVVDGSVAAVVQVTGNLDDFKDGAGFVAQTEVEVSPVRVAGVPFGSSHLHLTMTQRAPRVTRAIRRTGCGNPVGPPFERQAYLADTSSKGEFVASGDLFGGTVHLSDVTMTRQKEPVVTGRASLQNLDVGAVSRALVASSGGGGAGGPPSADALSGQLSGNLEVERLPVGDLGHAKLRFDLQPSVIARGAQRLSILQPKEPIVVSEDVLTVPAVELRLESGQAFNGGLKVAGTVTSLTHVPEMNFQAALDPIDLGVLTRLFPRVERASGRLEGRLSVTGRLSDPKVAGELHAKADEISARGLPSGFSDVKLDVFANATEIAATGSGRFAGGTLFINGSAPIRGLSVGDIEATISAHGMRVTPSDGIVATFDADLSLELDAQRQEAQAARNLPRVSGEVTVTSFEYTRGITLDLATLGGRARRTVVESYDPSLDNVRLDGVRVRAKAPFKIRNNLVEVQLGIDSGELTVTGTDQRIGLRGALKTLPGGRFHFRANDFDIQQGTIRFEDPTRIAPNVDVLAVTEYRRFTDSSAASRGTGGTTGASLTSGAGTGTGGGAMWRISLHAYGDTDNLKLDMTSEPRLSQEDIVLLLTMGMTRAELDQLQTGSVGASIALTALGTATGADRAVKEVIPVIDDFRFGSGTTRTGKTDPQVTVGKRLTDSIRATVTTGLSEDRELRSNIEWRLTQKLSLQGSYDNINDVSSSAVGNVGVDLRWRLEFE